MLTVRETAALRRMQETVALVRFPQNPWSPLPSPWHESRAVRLQGWRMEANPVCYAETVFLPYRDLVAASLSDLRIQGQDRDGLERVGFIRDLCPACAKALGLKEEALYAAEYGDLRQWFMVQALKEGP